MVITAFQPPKQDKWLDTDFIFVFPEIKCSEIITTARLRATEGIFLSSYAFSAVKRQEITGWGRALPTGRYRIDFS